MLNDRPPLTPSTRGGFGPGLDLSPSKSPFFTWHKTAKEEVNSSDFCPTVTLTAWTGHVMAHRNRWNSCCSCHGESYWVLSETGPWKRVACCDGLTLKWSGFPECITVLSFLHFYNDYVCYFLLFRTPLWRWLAWSHMTNVWIYIFDWNLVSETSSDNCHHIHEFKGVEPPLMQSCDSRKHEPMSLWSGTLPVPALSSSPADEA